MQASETHDLSTPEGRHAAVIEASGGAEGWTDVPGVVSLYDDPAWDKAYWTRVWTNQLVQGDSQAFDVPQWQSLARARREPKAKTLITLGFDGAQFHDGTALVATEVATGFQWLAGLWECPPGGEKRVPPWQVPVHEVDGMVRDYFKRFNVWRLYADPPYWQEWVAKWEGEFTEERVIRWYTNRRRQMSAALENFKTALKAKTLSHDGDDRLKRHIGNARRWNIPGWRDETGHQVWLIQKDRPDSPRKIDAAMASILSWEARTDAIADGKLKVPVARPARARIWTPEGFVDAPV